jgi:hypothetical protein
MLRPISLESPLSTDRNLQFALLLRWLSLMSSDASDLKRCTFTTEITGSPHSTDDLVSYAIRYCFLFMLIFYNSLETMYT